MFKGDRSRKNTLSEFGFRLPSCKDNRPLMFEEWEEFKENFADKKVKGKSRPGRVKRAGASCKGSVTSLRAKAKKYGGEKGKI